MANSQMILFEYGHTLLYEPEFSTLRGTEFVMRYAIKNPRNFSPEQVNDFAAELHSKTHRLGREAGLELSSILLSAVVV